MAVFTKLLAWIAHYFFGHVNGMQLNICCSPIINCFPADFRLLENMENNLDRMGRANRDFGQLKYTPRFVSTNV